MIAVVHEPAEADLISERTRFYRAFWRHFAERVPLAYRNMRGNESARWRYFPRIDLVVSQYLTDHSVGVFIRGRWGMPTSDIVERLAPHGPALRERLGTELGDRRFPYISRLAIADPRDPLRWDEMADWIDLAVKRYGVALTDILDEKP